MQKHVAPSLPEAASYQIKDPAAFGRNLLNLLEESGKVVAELMEKQNAQTLNPLTGSHDTPEMVQAWARVWQTWLSDPVRLSEAQGELFAGYLDIWTNTLQRLSGQDLPPVAVPEPGDNRFKDPGWSENAYFDTLKQAYLLTSRWAEQLLENTEGLDERTRHQAEFLLKQIVSALSPSNFPATNPEVVRETFARNAGNLVDGMRRFLADLEKSGSVFKISQTDTTAFEVGVNIAVTPGKVVFQNELLQLIQYTPSTEKVRSVPLLIVPPWINKFYILDLSPQKSFIKYVVGQGFTVFVVSWVNPDGRLKDKTFDDYMQEGILAAAEAVRKETGQKKCNVLGYCVGGTLLAATLAWLAARGEDIFASATFLAAQADFSKAGDLKLFIDDSQLKNLEEMMAEHGYLDGSHMATVFNLLRPKDLIWPYIVNNYMLGKQPFPFDLLYWNQDSTRMPAANHAFYLRQFYLENKLARGEMVLGNVKLDLKKVKLPVYHLAAREDHIAPARSVYIGARLLGGPVEYVLSGSGHIAGVINPPNPDKPKYQYWTNPDRVDSLDEWLEGAKETPGSWWPHWIGWLTKRSGGLVEAREPGATLGVIEDAPGSYVRAQD
ncbi:MAG: PHA/PHB synthase family protein [Hyphomicrobiaceae bacterium]